MEKHAIETKYKLIYGKKAEKTIELYGSLSGIPAATDEKLGEISIKPDYKLFYEKEGKIYGSHTGLPTDIDEVVIKLTADEQEGTEEKPDDRHDEGEEPTKPQTEPEEKTDEGSGAEGQETEKDE